MYSWFDRSPRGGPKWDPTKLTDQNKSVASESRPPSKFFFFLTNLLLEFPNGTTSKSNNYFKNRNHIPSTFYYFLFLRIDSRW